MISTYKIQTALGKEISTLDTIGYTGKDKNKVKTTRKRYLNSLNKGEFSVEQTKFDSGDFTQEFLIIRVTNDEKESVKSYKLIKKTPDSGGVRDRREEMAISYNYDDLVKYCEDNFNSPIGEPAKFSWNPYYIIEVSDVVVL